ncbi:MAG: TIGR03905 family TSCPD domain-containing protein [Defluviitaleaceae bacterium]|nr:TIGR03905 family TSCPD domain-containing protein [Defluviitaleaceae bacterium]
MKNSFKTKGVCSTKIDFELKDGVIKSVEFTKGCDGNLKAISSLLVGMNAHDAVARLKGIQCGKRPTSCSDQLARALEQAIN